MWGGRERKNKNERGEVGEERMIVGERNNEGEGVGGREKEWRRGGREIKDEESGSLRERARMRVRKEMREIELKRLRDERRGERERAKMIKRGHIRES